MFHSAASPTNGSRHRQVNLAISRARIKLSAANLCEYFKMIARFFGLGSLPHDADYLLREDNIRVCIEHAYATVTFRDFSRGGRGYTAWRRQGYFGSLVISDQRLLAYRATTRCINVPFDDSRFRFFRFEEPKPGTLGIEHPAGLFRKNWSGTIQYRYPVDDVCSTRALIEQLYIAASRR